MNKSDLASLKIIIIVFFNLFSIARYNETEPHVLQNLKKSYFRSGIRNPRFYVLLIFAAFKNKITKDIYEVKDKFHFFKNLEQFYFTIVQ